jgi:hypothetical protein
VRKPAAEPAAKPGRRPDGSIADPELARDVGRLGGRPAKIRPERGSSHVQDVLRGYEEIERRLVARGFPATSRWWRKAIARWYRKGCRQLVARVGRRGGKSSTLSRLAVAEALYGHHDVPPGDLAYAAIISTDRREAVGRLRTIQAILNALGVAYEPVPHTPLAIYIDEERSDGEPYRVGFRVFTASIAGVSGFTAFFVLCDEVSKWKDEDTGANPGREVLASVRPTMATQRNGRIVLSSSPFGMLDAHYDAFEAGETPFQAVAYAPTWEANPSVTEADTHGLEPDEAIWLREYKAVPQAEIESSLLTEVLINAATRAIRRITEADLKRHPGITHADVPYEEGRRYVATMDPATRRHVWTLTLATQGYDRKRRIVLAREWRPQPGLPLVPSVVLREIAAHLKPYGTRTVLTDQASADALAELGRQAGLVVLSEPWTQPEIRRTSEHVLKLLQEGLLELPPDPMVKMDLLGIRKVLTRNGVRYEFAEQRGRHSDYAPAILRAVDDVRWGRGTEPVKPQTVEQTAQSAKAKFLADREKERERAQRYGRTPVTHRPR